MALNVTPRRPAPAPTPDPAFESIEGLSPLVTSNDDFYVVDEELVDPDIDVATWRLAVGGMVDGPLDLDHGELLALPLVERYATLECISNPIGGDLISTAKWTGVPLTDLLGRAGVRDGALEVVFRAVGGYSDSLPIGDALRPETMIVLGMNGNVLPRAHGFPARLLAPGYYGMKQPKWLQSIEVVSRAYSGYWERRGWIKAAIVNTGSRVDAVQESAGQDGTGTWVVAGVAFAGNRGIALVECSLDGGATWRAAELEPPLSNLAWRRWKLAIAGGEAGGEGGDVLVRAADGDGVMQTSAVAPPHPSGATGYDGATL
jgi:DMSO/TMAO reductase YedYZ molybdopterin-dependent catalytic subunit